MRYQNDKLRILSGENMDRLTYRLEDQWGNPTDSIILKPYMRYEDEKIKKLILNRLASYEETGLTPQEIEQMKARMPLHQWAGESPEKMSIFSVSVSKIMELTKAEKQERILMLPCKVGDTLYDIYEAVNNQGFEDGVIKELKVPEIHINLDKRNRPWLIISNYMFAFEDFGKTVFLSKEEAEEALRNQ